MSLSRRLLLAGAALCLTAACIAVAVLSLGEPGFDPVLLERFDGWRDGAAGAVLRAASDVGYFVVLGPVGLLLAIIVLATNRDVGRALLLAGATPIAATVTAIIKETVRRERPSIDPDAVLHTFSMPSGHATSSSAFAMAVVLAAPAGMARIVVAVVAVAFALTVGASRVALGVHYPSDVLAGWCLGSGIACLLAAVIATRRSRDARAARR